MSKHKIISLSERRDRFVHTAQDGAQLPAYTPADVYTGAWHAAELLRAAIVAHDNLLNTIAMGGHTNAALFRLTRDKREQEAIIWRLGLILYGIADGDLERIKDTYAAAPPPPPPVTEDTENPAALIRVLSWAIAAIADVTPKTLPLASRRLVARALAALEGAKLSIQE